MKIHLLLTAILLGSGTAFAAVTNETCLECHSNPTITGSKGQHPFVDPAQFARTSHASVGCTSCHNAVPHKHPDDHAPVSKANCQDCHAELLETYSKSIHGNNASCGDCHNPHTVKPPVAVSGADINAQCNKCHDPSQTLGTHSKWLPQAGLHMEAAPCISCHAESKDYVITLFLQKRNPGGRRADFHLMTNYELSRILPGDTQPSQWLDTDKDGKISLSELRNFNLHSRPSDVRLSGVMMPEKMDHNFALLVNRRDCTFCHLSGPEARQTSFVAFPQRDGSYERVEVEKGAVLDALFGTPDFYMVGSTRSPILSLIGLVIIAGGIAFPVLHGTFRWRTRANRQKKSH